MDGFYDGSPEYGEFSDEYDEYADSDISDEFEETDPESMESRLRDFDADSNFKIAARYNAAGRTTEDLDAMGLGWDYLAEIADMAGLVFSEEGQDIWMMKDEIVEMAHDKGVEHMQTVADRMLEGGRLSKYTYEDISRLLSNRRIRRRKKRRSRRIGLYLSIFNLELSHLIWNYLISASLSTYILRMLSLTSIYSHFLKIQPSQLSLADTRLKGPFRPPHQTRHI